MTTPINPTAAVVLIVEDEPLLRLSATDLVEDQGFTAVEAMNAKDAIRILESRPDIRIVFTDIDMPGGIDGMKLAATIRDRWPPIELIITSGKWFPDVEALPVRAVFFSKPYRREQVAAVMQEFARSVCSSYPDPHNS